MVAGQALLCLICVRMLMPDIKKPGSAGFFSSKRSLLNFRFFIHHVLANNGIKFFDLELLRHGALVFVCGVEVTGTGT